MSIFIWAVVLKWALLLSCVHWVSSRSLAPLPAIAHCRSICPLWSNSEFTPSDLAKHFLWFTAVWFLFQLYISALDMQEHVTWTLLQPLMYLTCLIVVIFRNDGNKCVVFFCARVSHFLRTVCAVWFWCKLCAQYGVCDCDKEMEGVERRGGGIALAGGLMMQCSGRSVMKQHEGRDYSN